MGYIRPIEIGKLKIENNIFLAPMAGITDSPFRILCKRNGAGLVYTEMVSSKGLFYNDKNTKQLLKINELERPIAIQIFGADADVMGEVSEKISQLADIIDINIGCPAHKVVKNEEGSALMKNPELVQKIIKAVVKNSRVPVTVKIRKGWDGQHINAVEIAKIAETEGIQAITVHGRTREELYTGKSDLEIIKKVKENVKIPVIGNGDIVDGETAKRMFEHTGCDAIMIGRAAIGNPWIFKNIEEYLQSDKEYLKPSKQEIKNMINEHLKLLIEEKGEYTAIREMRKQIAMYIKGLPFASEMRNEVNKIEESELLREKIREYLK